MSPAPARLLSLDIFRGLVVAGMILVMNAGDWSHIYWPLLHAQWNGWTPTDMIFPSFLFMSGWSMTLSASARSPWNVVRRSALLCTLGLFLNAFPFFHLATLRIPGVLQRIALCYLVDGLLYLAVKRPPAIAATAVVLLAGYWALMLWVPVPGCGAGHLDSLCNLEAYLDRTIFGIPHLWPYGLTAGHGVTYDPEGLLSTIPAIATFLFGILAGEWMRSARAGSRKAAALAVAGASLIVTGLLLDPVIPINKRIWSPSFALFAGGFSALALALLYWMFDLHKWRWGMTPALILGSNAIFVYALALMLSPLLELVGMSHRVFAILSPKFLDPYNASLAWAILFLLVILGLTWPLYRKRLFLRI